MADHQCIIVMGVLACFQPSINLQCNAIYVQCELKVWQLQILISVLMMI